MSLLRSFVLRERKHLDSLLAFLAANWQACAEQGSPLAVKTRPMDDTRNLDQNAKFHSICGDIAKSGTHWAGKPRTAAQWKVLLVSGHTVATKGEVDLVPGLEGEYLNIRESTALMSIKRCASLITYSLAFCDQNSIALSEPPVDDPRR